MNIRVISGKYGGRVIEGPEVGNRQTHPMSERIRNAMFNSIGSEVVNAEVLDVFAGTGAVGFEALSRGASHCTFVERNKVACRILDNNIKTLRAEDETKVIKTTLNNWLETREEKYYDIIFADPPYNDLQLSTVSKLFGLLKPNGLMVLSHTGRGKGPILANTIVVVDNRSYGNASLTFFRRRSS